MKSKVDFKEYIRELHSIYDLYTLDDMNAASRSGPTTTVSSAHFRSTVPGERILDARTSAELLPREVHMPTGRKGSVRVRSLGNGDVSVDFSFD